MWTTAYLERVEVDATGRTRLVMRLANDHGAPVTHRELYPTDPSQNTIWLGVRAQQEIDLLNKALTVQATFAPGAITLVPQPVPQPPDPQPAPVVDPLAVQKQTFQAAVLAYQRTAQAAKAGLLTATDVAAAAAALKAAFVDPSFLTLLSTSGL